MTDTRRRKLADVLVNYCVSVQLGEWVVITGSTIAEPLINDLVEKVLIAGGNPTAIINSGEIQETRFKHTNEAQLKWIPPLTRLIYEKADAMISISAAENLRSLSNIDPEKQRIQQSAGRELFTHFLQRMAEGKIKWVGTQYPCSAHAQEADMSLRDLENFVYGATLADQDDPVSLWQAIKTDQQRLADWVNGKKNISVKGPHVDLVLSIEGREFINDGGKENMPGGEIYTSPVEDSANGWIEFTYPAIMGGREVEGIRLEFKDGKVTAASANKNEEYLLKMLDSDEGARYLGEFAIGTNYGITRFTKSILYDEKLGGTIHLALGQGLPEAGGKNESGLHWDMICDMRENSQIRVDGELFYQNGKFNI